MQQVSKQVPNLSSEGSPNLIKHKMSGLYEFTVGELLFKRNQEIKLNNFTLAIRSGGFCSNVGSLWAIEGAGLHALGFCNLLALFHFFEKERIR